MIDTFKAVIFDMDGLLVDSERVWSACERDVLRRRGKEWNHQVQEHLIGKRMSDFLQGMIEGYGLTEPFDVLKTEILDEMCRLIPEQVVARPGAVELIAYLKEQEVPTAIASSSAVVIIDAVVESQGWHDVFLARVSGDEVPEGKPSPDVYLEAARRLGVRPADCLALEDSPNGARAAVAAGMTCYAVPDPWHATPESFNGITPYVFDSLHDVLKVLKESAPRTAN